MVGSNFLLFEVGLVVGVVVVIIVVVVVVVGWCLVSGGFAGM